MGLYSGEIQAAVDVITSTFKLQFKFQRMKLHVIPDEPKFIYLGPSSATCQN